MYPIRLRSARNKIGLSQEDVSDRLRIHLDVYKDYESGKREPYVSTAYKISKLLKADLGKMSKPMHKEVFTIYESLFPEKLKRGIPKPSKQVELPRKYEDAVISVKKNLREKKSSDTSDNRDEEFSTLTTKLYAEDTKSFEIVCDLIELCIANRD